MKQFHFEVYINNKILFFYNIESMTIEEKRKYLYSLLAGESIHSRKGTVMNLDVFLDHCVKTLPELQDFIDIKISSVDISNKESINSFKRFVRVYSHNIEMMDLTKKYYFISNGAENKYGISNYDLVFFSRIGSWIMVLGKDSLDFFKPVSEDDISSGLSGQLISERQYKIRNILKK